MNNTCYNKNVMISVVLVCFITIVMLKKKFINTNYAKRDIIERSLCVHNAVSILLNVYIFIGILYQIVRNQYSIVGNILNYTHLDLIFYLQVFHISRYYKLLDSVFLILRNKTKQISGLFVYHHISTIVFTWLVVTFYPGGDMYMGALLDSWIQIWMYLYYFSSMFIKYSIKHVWYEKLITLVQIVIFCISIVHYGIAMFYINGDKTIKYLNLLGLLQQSSFLVMYYNSYYKKYIERTRLLMKLLRTSLKFVDHLERYELKNRYHCK